MPCYHPNYMVYNNGEVGRFGGRLTDAIIASRLPGQDYVPIPCGHCIGCKVDRSKAWADRMLLEFVTEREGCPSKTALFLTVTYDNSHLPMITGTDGLPLMNLEPRDFQLFLKRLRKHFPDKRLRFYLGAEYGDHTWRPHGHFIIYGLSLNDFPDLFLYSHDSTQDTDLFESPLLNSIWSKGAVRFSAANYHTFAYVGRYVVKKMFLADNSSLIYRGRNPPFCRMSLRPGIGSDYFKDIEYTQVSIIDEGDLHKISVPRCVLDKLKLTDPELYDTLMSQRRYISEQRQEFIDSQTDLSRIEYLKQCESNFLERTKLLQKRGKL